MAGLPASAEYALHVEKPLLYAPAGNAPAATPTVFGGLKAAQATFRTPPAYANSENVPPQAPQTNYSQGSGSDLYSPPPPVCGVSFSSPTGMSMWG